MDNTTSNLFLTKYNFFLQQKNISKENKMGLKKNREKGEWEA